MDHKHQREELVKSFENVRAKLVELLEENLVAPELHQLSLAEFNLHLENKKERVKQVFGYQFYKSKTRHRLTRSKVTTSAYEF